MIIHSLRLRNIRSYVDSTIEFPRGAVLLSGDIGCGKTSILLAIEFAIFGIMKGVLSGNTLLRHGAQNGFVELSFTLGKDKCVIKRSLKRSAKGVAQEPGMLSINDKVVQGTAQELKARMLELIGYPESLLNKSKSLIFRYTVFTPQEEMKRILYESKDERLDILRRLFNIDKYKRVKENSLNYIRELKNKINVLKGKLEILPDKKQELDEYSKQVDELKEKLEDKEEDLQKIKLEFDKAKHGFESLEKELDELKKAEKEFEVKKSELSSASSLLEKNQAELKKVNALLDEMLKGLEGFDVGKADEIKDTITRKKQELAKLEQSLKDINSKKSMYKTKQQASEAIITKISKLDDKEEGKPKCPTCEQIVSPEHIKSVTAREQVIITKCKTNLEKLDGFEKKFSDKKNAIEKEIENYQAGEKELEAKKVKLEALEEKKERKKNLEQEISDLKDKISKHKGIIEDLEQELEKGKDKKQEFETAKKELEEKREEKDVLDKIVVEKKTQLETTQQVITRLKQEIDRMKQDEKKLSELNEIKHWLQNHFINLVDVIEKNILARIYNEFNAFFQEWFNTLLEDETISVRLDQHFSPVIEQNGYETWLENLSGGEKTSIALAYRLALNKVINDFLSTIRTRDLIILDEPTDGFSSEQLDRVREVINQTNVEQVLIVSHEAKMESFVDSIIRVRKQGHESRVY